MVTGLGTIFSTSAASSFDRSNVTFILFSCFQETKQEEAHKKEEARKKEAAHKKEAFPPLKRRRVS